MFITTYMPNIFNSYKLLKLLMFIVFLVSTEIDCGKAHCYQCIHCQYVLEFSGK